MTTLKYQQASERFLAQAGRELAAGDLQQASEKGWGAITQILKAIAEQRGWEHNRHRHYLIITSRLRAETGDGDIRRLFGSASLLHENFYENEVMAEDVAEGLDDVKALTLWASRHYRQCTKSPWRPAKCYCKNSSAT